MSRVASPNVAVAMLVAGAAIYFFWSVGSPESPRQMRSAVAQPASEADLVTAKHAVARERETLSLSVADGPHPTQDAAGASVPSETEQVGPRERKHPNFRRDIARLFALAPSAVTENHLVRHVDLNPVDAPLTADQLASLNSLLEEQKKLLHRQECSLGERRHEALMNLMHRGALKPLTLESLPPAGQQEVLALARQSTGTAAEVMQRRRSENPGLPPVRDGSLQGVTGALKQLARKFVPDASAFVLHDGVMHMATDKQLESLSQEALVTKATRRSFLYLVLAWFVEEGLTSPDKVSAIAEKFEYWIQKS